MSNLTSHYVNSLKSFSNAVSTFPALVTGFGSAFATSVTRRVISRSETLGEKVKNLVIRYPGCSVAPHFFTSFVVFLEWRDVCCC
ncbi:hypothetical protein GEMRC1_012578 [Eukaryota sp. GEM-RC1]